MAREDDFFAALDGLDELDTYEQQAPVRDAPARGPTPRRGLDPGRMVDITLHSESRNRDYDDKGRVITSPAGARYAMQTMPATARDPGYGIRPARNDSPEEWNRVGREKLGAMLKRYDGDPAKAWAAYNWGEGNVDKAVRKHGDNWLSVAPAETRNYVTQNLSMLGAPAGGSGRGRVASAAISRGMNSFGPRRQRALDAPEASVDEAPEVDFFATLDGLPEMPEQAPEPEAPKKPAAVGSNLLKVAQNAPSSIKKMGLKALQYFTGDDDHAGFYDQIPEIEKRIKANAPDLEGAGVGHRIAVLGAQGALDAAPVIAASAVNPLFGVATGAAYFGGSSGQTSYEKVLRDTADASKARSAGRAAFAIDGLTDTAQAMLPVGHLSKLIPGGAKSTVDVLKRATDTRVLVPFAKSALKVGGINAVTEIGQDAAKEYSDTWYGAKPEDTNLVDSGLAGFGMSMWLSALGIRGAMGRTRSAGELKQALEDPRVPADVRAQARDAIAAEAKRQRVAPEDIDGWLDQQFEQDDAYTRARENAERADLLAQQEASALEERGRYAQAAVAHVNDLGLQAERRRGLMTGQTDPLLGAIQEARGEAEAEAQAEQGAFMAQAEDSTDLMGGPNAALMQNAGGGLGEASAAAARPAQQSVPATVNPVQERAREVANAEQERNQRARKDFGIVKQGALTTFGELDKAYVDGLVSDEQFAELAGLLAGDATSLPTVRLQLAELQQQDRLLEQEAQQRRDDAEAVKQRPAPELDVDALVADLENAGVDGEAAVQQRDIPDTDPTPRAGETRGQATVRAFMAMRAERAAERGEKSKTLTETVQRRLMLALGFNVNGNAPNDGMLTPRTWGEVATIESTIIGKPVNEKTVSKSMLQHGITQEVLKSTAAVSLAREYTDEGEGVAPSDVGQEAAQVDAEGVDTPTQPEGAEGAEPPTVQVDDDGDTTRADDDGPGQRTTSVEPTTTVSTRGIDSRIADANRPKVEARMQELGVSDELGAALNYNPAAIERVPEAINMWSGSEAEGDFGALNPRQQARYVQAVAAFQAEQERAGATEASKAAAWKRFADAESRLVNESKENERGAEDEIEARVGTSLDTREGLWADDSTLLPADALSKGDAAALVSRFPSMSVTMRPMDSVTGITTKALTAASEKQRRAVLSAVLSVSQHPVVGPMFKRALRSVDSIGVFSPKAGTSQHLINGFFSRSENGLSLNTLLLDAFAADPNNEILAGRVANLLAHEVAHPADYHAGLAIGGDSYASDTPGGPLHIGVVHGEDGTVEFKMGRVAAEMVAAYRAGRLGALEQAFEPLLEHLDAAAAGERFSRRDIEDAGAAARNATVETWPRMVEAMAANPAAFRNIAPRAYTLADKALKARSDTQMGNILAGRLTTGENDGRDSTNRQAVPGAAGGAAQGRAVARPVNATPRKAAGVADGRQAGRGNLAGRLRLQPQEAPRGDADGGKPAGRKAAPVATRAARGAVGEGRPAGELEFSLNAPLAENQREALTKINSAVSQLLQDGMRWMQRNVAFTRDLVDAADKFLPSARGFYDLKRAVSAARVASERNIDSVLEDFDALTAEERGTGAGTVNAFLKASTLAKKWGYMPEHLKGRPGVTVDPALKAQFDALSPKAQAVVKRVFEHGHTSLQEMKKQAADSFASDVDVLIEAARKRGDKAAEAKALRTKLLANRQFESMASMDDSWPYAPLRRFGNFVVAAKSADYIATERTVEDKTASEAARTAARKRLRELRQDGKHYVLEFQETRGEARRRAEELRATNAFANVDNFAKEAVRDNNLDTLGAFHRLREMVNESTDPKLRDRSAAALDQLMTDLHLSLLSEQSARQAERHREGVAGANDNMMRAFESHGRAMAHFTAALTSTKQIQETISRMRDEVRKGSNGTREVRQDFFNELLKRHMMDMDYKPNPYVGKAMSVTSTWMLLTSPSYHLMNATQPWAVSLPVMAGKHGYARSQAALLKAYRDLAPAIKDGVVSQDDYHKLPEDIRDAVNVLTDAGVIDISLESHLGRWGQAGNPLVASVSTKLNKVAQTVETFNRLTTAVAALRLEAQRNDGEIDESGIEYARDIIDGTHFDYSGFNAPRAMRTNAGMMLTQFRKFQLGQATLFTRLVHDSFKDSSPKERAVARRALAYSVGHMGILGGAMGLPGFHLAAWLLDAVMGLFGDDDEPWDTEEEMRKALGPEWGLLLGRGVPAAMGYDISGRVGAGGMLSLLPFTDIKLSRDGWSGVLAGASGPFLGGVMPRGVDGIGLMTQGQYWKGLEGLLPKGLADASRALRQETQGVTNRRGDVLLTPQEVQLKASLGQAFGVPGTQLSERGRKASVAYKTSEFYKSRAAAITREYVAAAKDKDTASMAEARQKWVKLQAARKEAGFKPQPLSTLIRAPQAQAKREKNVAGGLQYRASDKAYVERLASDYADYADDDYADDYADDD